MKKLLLLVGLVVFLVTSFAYSWDGPDEYKIYLKEKKKCLLDHMLEIDNDRASKEIDKACDVVGEIATGARDHNAKYWDEEIFFANCVFKNINTLKVPTDYTKLSTSSSCLDEKRPIV